MGTFNQRGKELLYLSNQDPHRRERIITAKIDNAKRLITSVAPTAVIG